MEFQYTQIAGLITMMSIIVTSHNWRQFKIIAKKCKSGGK